MLPRLQRSEMEDLVGDLFEVGDDANVLLELSEHLFASLDELDEGLQPAGDWTGRDPGRRPEGDEDPLNAIVRWCRAPALGEGSLDGVRVALKDSIAVAGVPLSYGSKVVDDYVPDEDAVVVDRLLRAGAEIVAMTNMDNLAFSGGGDTSAYGSVLNPFDPTRTAAGSSGGSGAALHYPTVDVSLGTDQGGSIRLPAAWSGAVGIKPTIGLVPYTGILGIDRTFDHVGPLARNTTDLARVLKAIAGETPADQLRRPLHVEDYVQAVEQAPDSLSSFRIGILKEGLEGVDIEPEVADAFWAAVERMREIGANITEVSVPEHHHTGGIAFAGFIEGITSTVAAGGNPYQWTGHYTLDLPGALSRGIEKNGDRLPNQVKVALLVGRYLQRRYHGEIYARAQNRRGPLREAYDRALASYDALLMPTCPVRPHVDDHSLPPVEHALRGWSTMTNTGPMDMTGHPGLSMPAAEAGGLPVGLMLVGAFDAEAKLLEIARTYEAQYGWLPAEAPAVGATAPSL